MTPGEFIKVSLRGEAPWAECVAINEDGTWQGRIANRLVAECSQAERREMAAAMFPGAAEPLDVLHDFKYGDIVLFRSSEYGWVPAEQPSGQA